MYTKYAVIRDLKGLKDIDVAKGTGIATSTLSDWKTGKSKPKTEKLVKIAKFLECSIEALI